MLSAFLFKYNFYPSVHSSSIKNFQGLCKALCFIILVNAALLAHIFIALLLSVRHDVLHNFISLVSFTMEGFGETTAKPIQRPHQKYFYPTATSIG